MNEMGWIMQCQLKLWYSRVDDTYNSLRQSNPILSYNADLTRHWQPQTFAIERPPKDSKDPLEEGK